ncbi:MAG TPA: hypothetical protein PK990_09560 [Salinivirgaceae bacterium]|nr:hypothetical protein [Salinivirgaceae bacterium]
MNALKIDNTIIEKLFATSEEQVLEAIQRIRTEGNELYLSPLIKCYQENNSGLIRKKITELINDIKHPDAVPIIISEIKKTDSPEIRSLLLTACWSSGLPFEEYFEDFVDIVIESDYLSAFEALTVIDNFSRPIAKERIRKCKDRVASASINETNHQKKTLFSELVVILKRMEEDAEEPQD